MSDAFMAEPQHLDWHLLLTPDERAWMLGDIARVSLAVGARLFPAASLSDLDVSAGSLLARKSPMERLGFILHALPGLAQAVTQIGRGPLTDSVCRTRPVSPPVRARRVGTAALLQAARRGASFRTLEETLTTVTADTPENRAVKAFLALLAGDSAAIACIATAEEEWDTAARAESCHTRLGGLLAAPWWEEVGPERAVRPPTRRAAARPEYARLLRERDQYRAAFCFDWTHPRLTLPARETWKLYETWCLFAVVETLGGLGYAPAAAPQDAGMPELFALREGRLTWTLAGDTASRLTLRSPDGRRLTVTYRRTFAEGRESLSHAMQPDITLDTDGRLWILDAKFKPYALPGEEGGDINQMHAYRDAIVDADGKRVVAQAWCLYAGQADAPNRALVTYGRTPQAVGALCLRPGDPVTAAHLASLLGGWLGEAPPTPGPSSFP